MQLTPSDAQPILEVTQRLISQLEIRGLDPGIVTAEKRIKLDPRIYKSKVVLPFSLWDKLSPDEWRPLIASRLIYDRNLTKKKKGMAIYLADILFPYYTIFFFLAISQIIGLIPQTEPVASGLIVLWVLAMIPVAKMVFAPFFRALQKTADKSIVGACHSAKSWRCSEKDRCHADPKA